MRITFPTQSIAEAEAKKENALSLLTARRAIYINRGRRALLNAMLADNGEATADDVRAVVALPPGINPNLFGAVPGLLARAGIIRLADLRPSARAARHVGLNRVWQLANRAAAWQWLASHPDTPEPSSGIPLDFEPNKAPGAGTPGKN